MKDHAQIILDQRGRQLPVLVQLAGELGDRLNLRIAHARAPLVEKQKPRLPGKRHHDPGRTLVAMAEVAHSPMRLFRRAADKIRKVNLPAPSRPITAPNASGTTVSETLLTAARLPKSVDTLFDFEQRYDMGFLRMTPSTPRGESGTTGTKKRLMNDIQFAVWPEI